MAEQCGPGRTGPFGAIPPGQGSHGSPVFQSVSASIIAPWRLSLLVCKMGQLVTFLAALPMSEAETI